MEERREEGAVFNMAIATLMRIDAILTDIKLLSVKNSIDGKEMSEGVSQHTKYRLVNQLFIQSVPLFNPDQREEQIKEIQKDLDAIKLQFLKHIDTKNNKRQYISKDYSPHVERGLDEVTIKIQKILQQEKYFMPPKTDPRYSWRQG